MFLNAEGFNIPARAIVWPASATANEDWCVETGSAKDRYGNTVTGSFMWTYYNNEYLCLNVSGENFSRGNSIVVYPCAWAYNELFDWYPISQQNATYLFSPSYGTGGFWCLNVSGGVIQGHPVILWDCNSSYQNEWWQPLSF